MVIIHGIRPPQTDVLGPLGPGRPVKPVLHCHKQRIIPQPPAIIRHKPLIILILTDFTALISLSQKRIAGLIHFLIIHTPRFIPKIRCLTLRLRQHPLLHQRLQADKIRIPGKGGKRLIRRISIAGGAQRQNLPIGLPRPLQPVHKIISAFRKTSNPVLRRQTGNRQQHSSGSVHILKSPLFSDKVNNLAAFSGRYLTGHRSSSDNT